MKKQHLLIGCSLTSILTSFAAASVTIVTDATPVYTTGQVGPFTTTGGDMAGVIVSVSYADGSTETATWSATGPMVGEAAGTGFVLSQANNTFTQPFTLTNTGTMDITGFSINTVDADKIIDITDPNPGTEGSAQGTDFDLITGGDATASYSDAVILDADPFVGDLYASLDISLVTPLGIGSDLTFLQDIDNAPLGLAPIITPEPVIPEPSSGIVLGLLLSSAAFMRRRK